MSESARLGAVNKLINQFAASIKHRPFINQLDKARTLAFIRGLRDIIACHPKMIPDPKVLDVEMFEITDEIKANNLDAIRQLRKDME